MWRRGAQFGGFEAQHPPPHRVCTPAPQPPAQLLALSWCAHPASGLGGLASLAGTEQGLGFLP